MAQRRRGFLKAKDGNVAILVAFSILPMTLASMGAVDIFRASGTKVQLQDALDAAALGAARINTTDDAVIQAAGERFLNGNLPVHRDFTLTASTFDLMDDGRVVARADAKVQPLVAGFTNGGDVDIVATTEVRRANSKLEIALVLDVTGSMEGTKLSNLKTAAKNFVTTMEQAQARSIQADAIKIALVPFAATVNVGPANRTAAWMDRDAISPINNEIFTYNTTGGTYAANRFALFDTLGTAWGGCVEDRKAPYDIQNDAPTAATPATLHTPFFAPDEPDNFGTGKNSYVTDTVTSGDWRIRQGSVNKYKKVSGLTTAWGPNRYCSMKPLRPLTQSYQTLRDDIDGFTADGDTNITLGLAWGWNTLSPTGPFASASLPPAAYKTEKLKKVVVLMTDGQNKMTASGNANKSYYSGAGYIWQGRVLQANNTPLTSLTSSDATRTAAMDSRLSKLCQNMKAANVDIEIYTIRVEVTTGTSAVLSGCATDANHFYDVQSASQLNSVFQNIAGQIANLHLAR